MIDVEQKPDDFWPKYCRVRVEIQLPDVNLISHTFEGMVTISTWENFIEIEVDNKGHIFKAPAMRVSYEILEDG